MPAHFLYLLLLLLIFPIRASGTEAIDAELQQHAATLSPTDATPIMVFSNRGQALLRMRYVIPAWFPESGLVYVPLDEMQQITWHDWQGGDIVGNLSFNEDWTGNAGFNGMAERTHYGQLSVVHNDQLGWVMHGELMLDGLGVMPEARRINDSVMLGYSPNPPATRELMPELTPVEWEPLIIFSAEGMAVAKFANPAHFWFSEADWGVGINLDADSTLGWDSTIYPGKFRGRVTPREDGSVWVQFNGLPKHFDQGGIFILQPDGSLGRALSGNFSTHGVENVVHTQTTDTYLEYATTLPEQTHLTQLPLREDFEQADHAWRREDIRLSASMSVVDCGEPRGRCLQVTNQPAEQPESWHLQIKRVGIKGLSNGHHYRGSVRLKADHIAEVPISLTRDVANWESFGLAKTCAATTEWSTCEFEFTTRNNPGETPEEARLAFSLGKVWGTVWLDDIQLGEAIQETTHSLTLSRKGAGILSGSHSSMICETDCVLEYPEDSLIALQAVAAAGWQFMGWEGDDACHDGHLRMDGDYYCQAVFNPTIKLISPEIPNNYTLAMNWAEIRFPDFFPAEHRVESEITPFLVRYYPETNTYLGYNYIDTRFYGYNPDLWGGILQPFGLLGEYLPYARAMIPQVGLLGDSITEALPEESYPLRLERLLGNGHYVLRWEQTPGHGVTGATATQYTYLPIRDTDAFRDLLTTRPDILAILLGTNDSLNLPPELFANFEDDYRHLVNIVRNLPIRPHVILVYPPPLYAESEEADAKLRNSVIPAIQRIAEANDLLTLDLYHADIGYPEHYPDGIHPDPEANQKIAELFQEAILEATQRRFGSVDP